MSDNPGAKSAPDPFAPWRAMYQTGEEAWSQMIDQMLGTEAFAKAMGQYLDSYLKTQEATRKNVEASLSAMNFPTKSDLTRLASQIVAVDAKLDDLSFAVDELSDRVRQLSERGPDGVRQEVTRLTAAVDALSAKLETLDTSEQPPARPASRRRTKQETQNNIS